MFLPNPFQYIKGNFKLKRMGWIIYVDGFMVKIVFVGEFAGCSVGLMKYTVCSWEV